MKRAMLWTAILATASIAGCSRQRARVQAPPDAKLVREFAEALGARDFNRAHGMLASETRATVGPAQLEAEYTKRIPASAGAPTEIEIANVESDWAERQAGDVVRVWVGIGAGPHSAVFTAVVAEGGGTRSIRVIEWQK